MISSGRAPAEVLPEAKQLISEKKLDEAIKLLHTCLFTHLYDASVHHMLGVAHGMHGDLDQAVTHFQEAIRYDPHNAETHYMLAVALHRQERVSEAITHLEKALRENPDYSKAVTALQHIRGH
jgi:Flp pilus assembly protein TadD